MRTALGLARRGLGRVWPNPAVGCVIVAEGVVVGRGWTQPGGRPHAETMALDVAGARARGAVAYVTLEPCAHVGRTPACAAELAAAGIARVVATIPDPDPRVSGKGYAMLRAAGVEVATGLLAAEAAALNAGFLSRIGRGRPRLTLKLATSLDGRIATADGESRWITGPLARREVHLMRATSDAVLVGSGTARADDPRLDVRDIGLGDRQPVRVVVAGALGLSRDSHLGRSAGEAPLWLAHHAEAAPARRAAWTERGATLIEVPFQPDGQLDLGALFQELGARGLTRVLCEGGGRLAGALLAADLVDEVVAFVAGLALGGEGVAAVGAMEVAALADAPRFRLAEVSRVGGDVRARWERAG
ncbi:MAG: bifunctional diaminohydroxyphosphoribosylaminopyrimidine deaminase/5-amino-6-(5-phosphoribosylamino)uracil reductase RibD [Amaricoccus sp.]|nr:bifunctional diaminohydroxyphosphoribosylaminopyrimidine deaminase/5-amino-6-(5-phosphoribosylamino)uracil reductase RibD [Amaricoccus sp.]